MSLAAAQAGGSSSRFRLRDFIPDRIAAARAYLKRNAEEDEEASHGDET